MSHYTILPLAERMKRYLVLLALAWASYLLIAFGLYRESSMTSPGSIGKPRFEPRTTARLRPLVIGNPEISEFANSMAIVEVLGGTGRVNYKTAIDSVECYAHMNGHYMYILKTEDFFRECGHYQDFYYRRHCVIHVLMEGTSHEWYSFLDSDMEIININGSFQDYVGPNFDVYLYDRFWNWEITAGAYIVRGNQFGRDFVRGFGEYEFRHPRVTGHDGTDNGGIHFFVASLVLGADSNLSECWNIWENATSWDAIFVYEWCIRKKLGARSDFGRIKLYSKGRGWARDGPLTNHQFAPEVDFIIHARKEVWKFSVNNTGGWHDARTVPLVMEDCRAGTQMWINNASHVIKPEEVRKRLGARAGGIFQFLKDVHSRQNLTAEFKQDMANHSDVIAWLSSFPFDPQWNRRL